MSENIFGDYLQKMKKFTTIAFCLFLLITAINAQTTATDKTETETEKKPVQKTNQRPDETPAKKEPYDDADVKTMATKCVLFETEKGNIKLEMFPESAPVTVRNFLNLVALGYLDMTSFNRVVPNFVIQGGDLYTNENITNDMKWRAVKKITDEPNPIRHEKGIISMARTDEPNSASTNFFILLTTSNTLDGKFAAFGRVTEGIEVVETINKMDVENEKPKEPVRIKKATIFPCSIPETPKETEKPSEKTDSNK